MKVTRHALVAGLCYATLGLALPFQLVLTSDTPTIRFTDSARPLQHLPAPVLEQKPSFKEYLYAGRQKPQPTAGNSLKSEFLASETGSTATQVPSELESDSARDRAFRDHYGAVLGKLSNSNADTVKSAIQSVQQTPNTNDTRLSDTTRVITYLKPVDLLDIIDKHGPECVALAIFVLVPIAYFILELLEFIIRRCVPERYPRQGRSRVRLSGPERQLQAWRKNQREPFREKEKHWRQTRRGPS